MTKPKAKAALAAARRAAVPAAAQMDAPSGLSGALADFTAGSDGKQSLIWARYSPPAIAGALTYSPHTLHAQLYENRERSLAASVAMDFATSNPLIATLLETLATNNVGTGLTLSSKIGADALGISKDDGRALASQIERAWSRWAGNPLECDLAGRHTVHELAAAAFRTWLVTGAVLATLDWVKARDARTRTKINLLSPAQLDQLKTTNGPGDYRTASGVVFDKSGRLVGYYIVPRVLGNATSAPMSKLIEAATTWGRQKVLHLFELRHPGQVRGLSPLVAALTPSQAKATLGDFNLSAAMLQTMYSLTLESDLPPHQAINSLAVNDGLSQPNDPLATAAARLDWYKQAKITPQPGVVNVLAPGDKLKMNRSETPNATFDPFDRSLTRQAARAAGDSYESVSGDYSQTSFSASRLATEGPHRVNVRRRAAITERFYKATFACWLEEAIESGEIKLPKGAPPFHAAKGVYTESKWLGSGRIVADPLKAVLATAKELELGLTTHTDALAERGIDFEEFVEARKAELEQLRAAGIAAPETGDLAAEDVDEDEERAQAEQPRPRQKGTK